MGERAHFTEEVSEGPRDFMTHPVLTAGRVGPHFDPRSHDSVSGSLPSVLQGQA